MTLLKKCHHVQRCGRLPKSTNWVASITSSVFTASPACCTCTCIMCTENVSHHQHMTTYIESRIWKEVPPCPEVWQINLCDQKAHRSSVFTAPLSHHHIESTDSNSRCINACINHQTSRMRIIMNFSAPRSGGHYF